MGMNIIVSDATGSLDETELEFISDDAVAIIQREEIGGEAHHVVLSEAMLRAILAMMTDYQPGGRLPDGVRVEEEREAA